MCGFHGLHFFTPALDAIDPFIDAGSLRETPRSVSRPSQMAYGPTGTRLSSTCRRRSSRRCCLGSSEGPTCAFLRESPRRSNRRLEEAVRKVDRETNLAVAVGDWHGSVTAGFPQDVRQRLHRDRVGGPRGRRGEPGAGPGGGAGTADQAREGDSQRLSVLLGWLRHAGSCRRGEDRQHRGRSTEPSQRGGAVPQGGGDLPASREPEPPDQGAPPRSGRDRVGGVGPRSRDRPRGGIGEEDPRRDVRRAARERQGRQRHHRHLFAGRRHPRQRVEPHPAEAHAGVGDRCDREPGPYLTQLERPRFGDTVRARGGHDVSAQHGRFGLHRDSGIEHGRVPPSSVPVADAGQAQGREADPRRSALHPHERGGRHPRPDPGGLRCGVPRRTHPLRPRERALEGGPVLQGVRRQLHQCGDDRGRRLQGYGRRRWGLLRSHAVRAGHQGMAARRVRRSVRHPHVRSLLTPPPRRDETLQHPRTVFQIVKRHFGRYTPEMVERVTGCPKETFLEVAETILANSGRERTTSFAYAVAWTQHTNGPQTIGCCALLQLLLGNVGRPGADVMALRGHASIQGSTDMPTLYHSIHGYMTHPSALKAHGTLRDWLLTETPPRGYMANTPKFMVSYLKSMYGAAAVAGNDFGYDWHPKIIGDHSHMAMFVAMNEGRVKGMLCVGQNPATSLNASVERKGLGKLEWLVVKDNWLTETAAFWQNAPEIRSGRVRSQDIQTEVFFFPAAQVAEYEGSFTNTQRMLQWHFKAADPPGDCRTDLWFTHQLARRLKTMYANSTLPRDRGFKNLVWEYDSDDPRERERGASGAGPGRPTAASFITVPRPISRESRGASGRSGCGGTAPSGRGTTSPTSRPTRRPCRRP